MLAEEYATVAGERSLHFGPEGKAMLGSQVVDNLASDMFFRSLIDLPRLRAGVRRQSREARLLAAGYIAGYNRYLRDIGPEGVPVECRGKAWVRPITIDDTLRLTDKMMILAGSLAFAPAIANAAPPTKQASAGGSGWPSGDEPALGSNGWAFGGDATANGRGMVIGNPHFPWKGPSRFWQSHVTLPGKIDVMGAGIAGNVIPSVGFNRDIAWTHTVTAARHFTVFELKLDPGDPTIYLVDGKPEKMTARRISVPVAGGVPAIERTLYSTRFGPVVALPAAGLGWGKGTAFALRDVNLGNQRSADTWLRIARAGSVDDVRVAISETLGIPWVNTIVADRYGNAMHADITAVPNVSKTFIKDCATPLSAIAAAQVVLLDGSRAACDWTRTRGAIAPGLLQASEQAVQVRRDYVTNSNDSYWLSNPRAPQAALSPILGAHGTAVSLRTRENFIETDAALAAGKIDHARAKALVFSNRSLAADLALKPMLALCSGKPDLARACAALHGWDGEFELDSRGAALFQAFWLKARNFPGLWSIPFDLADPVHTPRGLVTGGESGTKLVKALADAASDLDKANIALDARWGDVQVAVRGDERIPVHGGSGLAGVLNMQESRLIAGGLEPYHGSSYVQVVGFDETGPVADAILSYSQSTNPASPHFADQTRSHSAKQWQRLPFTRAAIEAARRGPPLQISEVPLRAAFHTSDVERP